MTRLALFNKLQLSWQARLPIKLSGGLALWLWLVTPLSSHSYAQSVAQSASEAAIKTAYIYNFAKFTEWPSNAFSSPTAPLHLCTLGKSELMNSVASLEGKQAQGHEIVIRRTNNMGEMGDCHLILLAPNDKRQLYEITHSLNLTPILTVSEVEGFVGTGGMLGLFVADDRVQFEANPEVVRRAGLKISSQLLKLARIVKETRDY